MTKKYISRETMKSKNNTQENPENFDDGLTQVYTPENFKQEIERLKKEREKQFDCGRDIIDGQIQQTKTCIEIFEGMIDEWDEVCYDKVSLVNQLKQKLNQMKEEI